MEKGKKILANQDYAIEYDEEWEVIERDNPPGYSLIAEKYATQVTVSSLSSAEEVSPKPRAEKWLEMRLNLEKEHTKKQDGEINVQETIKEIPIGYQIEYWGSDPSKRNFRYWGVVTKRQVINLYIESYGQTPEGLEQILFMFLRTLKINA